MDFKPARVAAFRVLAALSTLLPIAACGDDAAPPVSRDAQITPPEHEFVIEAVATFSEGWAMTFLPDGRALVTQKSGELRLLDLDSGEAGSITGVPRVAHGGQGGLGDVILHPGFETNSFVYLSYAEEDDGLRGAAVARARLSFSGSGGSLAGLEVLWRQMPKVNTSEHYAHRLAIRDGMLFITSGDRNNHPSVQDRARTIGKIIRLHDDGRVPSDNPLAAEDGASSEIWTLGHRNPLGLAFDSRGRLWSHEMGPRHGDELNLIVRGENYGWPEVSEGEHYDGRSIPGHATDSSMCAPALAWVPAISPAGLAFYEADLFPSFRGDAFLGGLSSQSLIRVSFDGERAFEAARYPMGTRIREVEVGPDGALYLLEDGGAGRLLRLSPAR